jgi:hypothetical protein
LEGDKKFSLHAKDVTMTAEQADLFFNPSETNLSDFADLVAAAEALKANLKIEGELLDMDSFKLNLSGKQIKVEGLVLTQAEFDALIAELKEIDSLKQAKITATVDGRTMIAKLENQPGRVKIEDKGLAPEERRGANRSSNSGKPERPERVERVSRGERPERPEKIERIERGGPGRQ